MIDNNTSEGKLKKRLVYDTVMIVDDNEIDLYIAEHMLRKVADTKTLCKFSNGKTAVNFLNETAISPSLIMLDIEMPVMNGLEVLNYCKEHLPHVTSNSKIVLLSAFMRCDYNPRELSKKYPFVSLFQEKPFNPNMLLAK